MNTLLTELFDMLMILLDILNIYKTQVIDIWMYKTNKSILLSRYSRWAVVNDMTELKISINLYYYYNVIPISFDFITFQESTCVTWILAVIIYFDAENRAMDWKENRSKREKYFEWTLKTHISLKMSKKDKKYNKCIKWRKILKFQ